MDYDRSEEQTTFPFSNNDDENNSDISSKKFKNSKKESKIEKIQILNTDFGNEKFLEDNVVVVKNEKLTTTTPQAIISSQRNLNFPTKNIEVDVIAPDNDHSSVALGSKDYLIEDGKQKKFRKLKNPPEEKKLKYRSTDQFEFF